MAEIKGRVFTIISKQFNIEISMITEIHDIEAMYGGDSLDQVEIAMALEEEFEFDVPDEEIEKVKTIQDIIDMVEAKING